MRTRVLYSLVSAFSRVLPPDCLRYGVATSSVWPRRTGCNQWQFCDFRSDSPLNFSWFWFQFWNRRENLRVCKFLMPQWHHVAYRHARCGLGRLPVAFRFVLSVFPLFYLAQQVLCQSARGWSHDSRKSSSFECRRRVGCSLHPGRRKPHRQGTN